MTAFALLFTLSAIGVAETVYLIRKRLASERPVCPIGGGCEIVLESKYNKTFGIHNDVLGLLFYLAASVVTACLVIGIEPMTLWETVFPIMIAFGSLMSLYLTYLQWRVIKFWCFWCLMSASTIWLMAIIIIISASI